MKPIRTQAEFDTFVDSLAQAGAATWNDSGLDAALALIHRVSDEAAVRMMDCAFGTSPFATSGTVAVATIRRMIKLPHPVPSRWPADKFLTYDEYLATLT